MSHLDMLMEIKGKSNTWNDMERIIVYRHQTMRLWKFRPETMGSFAKTTIESAYAKRFTRNIGG